MRFLFLLLAAISLASAADVTMHPVSLQVSWKDGVIVSALIYDAPVITCPISGTLKDGEAISPTQITAQTHPELFTALNTLATQAAARLTAAKAASGN